MSGWRLGEARGNGGEKSKRPLIESIWPHPAHGRMHFSRSVLVPEKYCFQSRAWICNLHVHVGSLMGVSEKEPLRQQAGRQAVNGGM